MKKYDCSPWNAADKVGYKNTEIWLFTVIELTSKVKQDNKIYTLKYKIWTLISFTNIRHRIWLTLSLFLMEVESRSQKLIRNLERWYLKVITCSCNWQLITVDKDCKEKLPSFKIHKPCSVQSAYIVNVLIHAFFTETIISILKYPIT